MLFRFAAQLESQPTEVSEPFLSSNLTVIVMVTGVGMPLKSVGVYTHCRTASRTASLSRGMPRRSVVFATRPALAYSVEPIHRLHPDDLSTEIGEYSRGQSASDEPTKVQYPDAAEQLFRR